MQYLQPKKSLLALLPFGYGSNIAMKMLINDDPAGKVFYHPDISVKDRERNFYNATKWAEINTAELKRKGYVRVEKRASSNPNKGFGYITLEEAGFYALTNIQQDSLPQKKTRDRNIKDRYVTERRQRHLQQQISMEEETDPDNYQEGSAKKSFLESVKQDEYEAIVKSELSARLKQTAINEAAGPLGYYPVLAKKTSLSSRGNMNNKQIYRRYRDCNIFALFVVNNFLTYLDRRHIDTNWKLEGNLKEITLSAEVEKKEKLELTEFLSYTLRHFYRNNPDVYSILRPSMGAGEWQLTPEVYLASELLLYSQKFDEEENAAIPNSEKITMHTFNAVGIGRRKNYIIHHARRGVKDKFPWYTHVEINSASAVQRSLIAMKRFTKNDDALVEHAIMVVEDKQQFLSFFDRLRENKTETNTSRKTRSNLPLCYPYIGIYTVPLNTSGAIQLRHLMLSTPDKVKSRLADLICQSNPARIRRADNSIYTLVYTQQENDEPEDTAAVPDDQTGEAVGAAGSAFAQPLSEASEGEDKNSAACREIPVYVGHLMHMGEIDQLVTDYDNGMEFLISCYPGQIAFYRTLMPDAKFL